MLALLCAVSISQATVQAKTIWATQKDTVWRIDVKYGSTWYPAGTGVAVTYGTRQYILTCKHVAEASYEITKDGKRVSVRYDGYRAKRGNVVVEKAWTSDPQQDIAAIRVDGLTPTARVAFSKPEIGDKVYSLGFPGDESLTIGEGIVNRFTQLKGREYIGHSADIYFGNSGGPLFNEKAEVVGLNSNWDADTNHIYFADPLGDAFKAWIITIK